MHLTEEQQAVVHSPASCLRVNALAGTGKTATLVAYAEARPSERLLYVAFNKAVQREAQNRFPPNVECRTAHSLAFRACGQRYQHKLGPDPKARDVVVALDLERCFDGDRTVAYLFAMDVLTTLKRWLNSSWAELDKRALHHSAALERLAPTVSSGALMDVAQQLWRAMCDRENTAMPMPHDGYLKRYQLSEPALAYDIVLFDEAQDANPAMTDIVLRQAARKVFVGDSHQQIYGFRGAEDALERLPADQTLFLSGSFRFGQHIARAANALLGHFKRWQVPLRGLAAPDTLGPPRAGMPRVLLCRSNAAVFNHAVENLASRLHFVGGIEGYRLERLIEAYHLYRGWPVADPFLRSFEDWAQFRELSLAVEDLESLAVIGVVERYGRRLPGLVRKIRERATAARDAAEVVLATAHKAKGLEFPQVQLAEDFAPLYRDEGRALRPPMEVPPEEINLLYVAATRARAVLTPNADLRRLVGEGGPTRLGRLPPASNVTHVSYLCNNDTYETNG
jgi:F-box protein 18 (helicase)